MQNDSDKNRGDSNINNNIYSDTDQMENEQKIEISKMSEMSEDKMETNTNNETELVGTVLPKMDVFKLLYYELKGRVEPESEAIKRDLSREMFTYLKQKIMNDELVVMEINGEVGTGKSTLGLQLQYTTNRLIENRFGKTINDYEWISSDQTEFLRLSRTDEENVCVEIDEFSAFGRTGANATTEMAEYEFFSDVCRIQYLHRIICSPSRKTDMNALVNLTIIGANKEAKATQVKITYRNMAEGQYRVLGTAWVNVEQILKTDTYRRYQKKKVERIALLKKVGVRDIRFLEFAVISRQVVRKLIEISKRGKVNLSTIRTSINKTCRDMKLQASYITEDEIAKPIHSVLDNVHQMAKTAVPEDKQFYKEVIQDELDELYRLEKAYYNYLNIN